MNIDEYLIQKFWIDLNYNFIHALGMHVSVMCFLELKQLELNITSFLLIIDSACLFVPKIYILF